MEENKIWKGLKNIGSYLPIANEFNFFFKREMKPFESLSRSILTSFYIIGGAEYFQIEVPQIIGENIIKKEIQLENKVSYQARDVLDFREYLSKKI